MDASEATRVDSDEAVLIDDENDSSNYKFFEFGAIRFVWNNSNQRFERQTALDVGHKIQSIQSQFSKGLTSQERIDKRNLHGENSIEIEVKSYLKLFIEEVLNPFYVFQIFSITL